MQASDTRCPCRNEALCMGICLTSPCPCLPAVVTIQAANSKKNLPAGVFWSCPGEAKPDIIQLAAAAAGPALAPAAAQQQAAAEEGSQPQQAQQQQSKAQRAPTAVESRALQWLAWARRVAAAGGMDVASFSTGSSSSAAAVAGSADSADDYAAAAAALAACPPYEVALSDVAVECTHCSTAQPQQLPYLLNGSVVALLGPAFEGEGEGAAGQDARPCLGMGLVRAVDMGKGLLHVLTDLSEEVLQQVQVLQAGRLELPPALLQTAQLQSPYLSLFCLSGGAVGAGTIKSRNNIQRASLLSG
jgi:hypothetical protein